ncbi:MAG: pyrroline-5-carboxylate reductase [Desulfuromonadaceae bacterium]|nr:pyrroline-5-carboxylate reductase [Desulfuromonadaceae bacterium]
MCDIKVGFVGGGNMAEALIRGLLAAGARPENLMVVELLPQRRDVLQQRYGVAVTASSEELVATQRLILLAVKPQALEAALVPLADGFSAEHCLVSMLAGVSTARIEQLLGGRPRVVRVMPNTPALIGVGAAGICRGRHATSEDEALSCQLFAAVGTVEVVKESLMDAVTGLSGSGPAYVFMLIEALADGGVLEGLPRDVALNLAAQTVSGAAQMVLQEQEHPAILRERVCSPAGTTIAAVRALEQGGLRATVIEAVARAAGRSRELGQH